VRELLGDVNELLVIDALSSIFREAAVVLETVPELLEVLFIQDLG
jgi:hypothetical protein